jgi:molecular chaperone HtpG
MQTGKIGVTTENIFPIIKKFLYSDHEIFLRELISNAVDATQKLKAMASAGDYKGELGDLTIRVSADKKKKTIKVSDNGIGMTQEELDKYLNQIAFSSANDFLDKYKDQANSIIGHFGLGFYSSFMVSDKVEVITKSWQEGAVAIKWTCDGSPEFTIDEAERKERGTDVILHIDKESKDFLEESSIERLLKKYCKFLPIEIAFGKEQEWKDGKYVDTGKDKIINNTKPAWTRITINSTGSSIRQEMILSSTSTSMWTILSSLPGYYISRRSKTISRYRRIRSSFTPTRSLSPTQSKALYLNF